MNPETIVTSTDRKKLRHELNQAVRLDPGLGELISLVGIPEPRKRSADFDTLLQVIVSQQLSTKVAAVISGRLIKLCGGKITWRKILNRTDDQLRRCGLSWRKVEYAQDLAMMIKTNALNLSRLEQMNTEEVVSELIKIRGFGRWSGEIFAMFALGHRDIFPVDDLALQVAVQRYLNLEVKPNGKQTTEIVQRWSPHRTAVALLMWKYYGAATMDK